VEVDHQPAGGIPQAAIEKLNWYALRWKIELFHKILKSGCHAEESKLRSSERLVNLIAIFCIIGWRIFWLTMLHRAEPDLPPAIALSPTEIGLLDKLVKARPRAALKKATISDYIIKIARLGGYLARAADPPPGNMACLRVNALQLTRRVDRVRITALARPLRVEFAGAVYHVMARGNERGRFIGMTGTASGFSRPWWKRSRSLGFSCTPIV